MRCFAKSRVVSWCVLFASVLGASIALSAADNSRPSPAASRTTATSAASLPGAAQRYGDLPLSFEANQGQADHQVRFLSRGSGYTFLLAPSEAVLAFSKNSHAPVLHMRLEGSNADPRVSGVDQLPGVSNYFIGQDPTRWRTGVPTYRKVAYENVYPGINLVYYGNQRQLEYDFVVSPGSDPRVIRLSVDGASKLTVDAEGNLVLHTDALQNGEGNVRLLAPKAYQDVEGRRLPVAGQWRLAGTNTAVIHLASYDRSKALVIDPVLVYSSFLGGSQANSINRIATDAAGNAYVAGYTASGDFPAAPTPTSTTFGSGPASRGAFVAKIDPTGSSLIYTTYLSGSGDEEATGLAVDASGNVYVAGNTHSTDFPVLGAFQSACAVSASTGACSDTFLTKIAASGTALVYSTYLGGTGNDSAASLAVDASGNAYVAGFTSSVDFPVTAGVLQAKCGGSCTQNAFVAKFNPSGETLAYATYLGGSASDGAADIAVDASGNAYLTGQTSSPDFPLATSFQKACTLDSTSSNGACIATSFVAKLKADGSALIYSTYLGGSLGSKASAIALDSLGSAYVAGSTQSADFPVSNAFEKSCGMKAGATQCAVNAFVTKFTPAGSSLVYSTYLGGSIQDQATGIAVNAAGNAHIIGSTASTDFPTVKSVQSKLNGTSDAFVSVLNSAGKSLLFSTFHGGSSTEAGNALALDAKGNIYVTGVTSSADFPTLVPFQSSCAGSCSNAFVTKMSAVPLFTSAAPQIAKAFTAATMPLNGTSTATFTLSNPDASNAQTGLGFTDTLPGSMTATGTNVSTTCAGGTATATAGATSISLSGGGLAVSPATCTVTADVTDTVAEAVTNSVTVSSTSGGPGNTATAPLTVLNPPSIGKSFGAASIAMNGTTSLTFNISNPNAGNGLTAIAFTDNFPAGLVVATPNGLSNTCGGTTTATAGSSKVILSAVGLGVSASCVLSVNVTGTTAGVKNNSVQVTSTNGGPGNTANATLTVIGPPAISKSFGAASVPLNGSTSLSFTIQNNNTTQSLSGIGFTDALPAGLVVSTPNGLSGTCGGGTITAAAGSSSVSLAGATLASSASCTFSVNVTGTTAGAQNNTTSAVTSTEGGNGSTASASVAVVAPPSIAKAFGAPSIALNGTTSLTLTITNPAANTVAENGVAFTDNLPAGLVVATPNGLNNTCGGAVSAAGGSASVSLAGGTIAVNSNCAVTVNVTGTADGNYVNTTLPVTSTNGGTGNTGSAPLSVARPPSIAKAFGAPAIALSTSTSLTFNISNPSTLVALTGVAFTDNLPAGLVVTTPSGLTNTCGGTATATAGSSTVSLSGVSLATSASCTLSVNVTGSTAGVKNNSVQASSTNGGTGGTSNASVTVVGPPAISKSFGGASIQVGGSTSLSFTIQNNNATQTLSGVGFTDTLPAGLVVSTPNGLSGACGAGTITATQATNLISLSGGTLAVSSSCTFSVNVTSTAAGPQNNVTTNVTSTEGGNGGTASASLAVLLPPTVSIAFGAASIPLNATTSLTFTISNPPSNVLLLIGVGVSDTLPVLPVGLTIANSSGAACNGGTLTTAAATGVITLTGGSVVTGGTCVFAVTVTGAAAGQYSNTTGPVTSTNGGTGAASNTATLTVAAPPTLGIAFLPAAITLNATSQLTFTVGNPAINTAAMNGVAFSDTLPTGLVVSTPNGLANTCGGTATATAGATVISLTGGSIATPGTSCAVTVNVTGDTAGSYTNTTGKVTSSNGGTGLTASASLAVEDYTLAAVGNGNNSAVVIQGGMSMPATITMTPEFGYAGTVAPAGSGCAMGFTCSFTSLTDGAPSSMVTVTAPGTQTVGPYMLLVTGIDGSTPPISHTTPSAFPVFVQCTYSLGNTSAAGTLPTYSPLTTTNPPAPYTFSVTENAGGSACPWNTLTATKDIVTPTPTSGTIAASGTGTAVTFGIDPPSQTNTATTDTIAVSYDQFDGAANVGTSTLNVTQEVPVSLTAGVGTFGVSLTATNQGTLTIPNVSWGSVNGVTTVCAVANNAGLFDLTGNNYGISCTAAVTGSTAQLNVAVSATSAVRKRKELALFYAAGLGFPAIVFMGLGASVFGPKRKRLFLRRITSMLGVLMLLSLLVLLPSCGGGFSAKFITQQAATYQLTVMGYVTDPTTNNVTAVEIFAVPTNVVQ